MILNYSDKQKKRELIYFSERKNNQGLKAVHPLQSGSNATKEYGTRINRIRTNYPKTDTKYSKEVSYTPILGKKENAELCPVRMMIDIRMTNGIRIQQRNLTYRNLKSLMRNWRDYAECYRNEQILLSA